jgi:undecaprenyl diphosphate synthase
MGIEYLTLYAFSKENWVRPKEEVDFLMNLLSLYLDQELPRLKENEIRFNVIGSRSDLTSEIQRKIERNKFETRLYKRLVLTLALSYSGRVEITEACRNIARKVKSGEIDVESVDESTLQRELYTADLPDPDLLIRTSGELRISNFLLWQISYAEIYVTEKFWPDFTKEEFRKAIEAYQKRKRRFGLVECPPPQ